MRSGLMLELDFFEVYYIQTNISSHVECVAGMTMV